jgi:hypothetical protein
MARMRRSWQNTKQLFQIRKVKTVTVLKNIIKKELKIDLLNERFTVLQRIREIV